MAMVAVGVLAYLAFPASALCWVGWQRHGTTCTLPGSLILLAGHLPPISDRAIHCRSRCDRVATVVMHDHESTHVIQ